VPWWGSLSPETIRELHGRSPGLSLDEIAIAASQRPEYAVEFDRLDVAAYTGREGYRFVFLCSPPRVPKMVVPVDNVEDFAALVVAVMLAPAAPAEAMAATGEGEPDLTGKPLPARAVLFALRAFAEGASIREVEKDAPFSSYTLANRVWTWHRSGAVRWDVVAAKLTVDPRYKLVPAGSETLRLIRL
jgi:hypothetical protein